jgi:hypothetical protein
VVVVGSSSAGLVAGESVKECGEVMPYLLAMTSDITENDKFYVTNQNI